MKTEKEVQEKLSEFTEYIKDLEKRMDKIIFDPEKMDEWDKLNKEWLSQRYAKSGIEWVLN